MNKLVVLAASVAGVLAWRSRRRRSSAHDKAVWHSAVNGPDATSGSFAAPASGAPKAP